MGILLSICRRRHDPLTDVEGQPINVREEFEMFEEGDEATEACVFLNPNMGTDEYDEEDEGGDVGEGREPQPEVKTTPYPKRKKIKLKADVL
ncbi:myristylated tegument protein [Equid gammaherpesvirus 2]|nr:myristylated tegument protein [Equid gammaherpesvirus 2]